MGKIKCPSCGAELVEGSKVAGKKEARRHDVSICRNCAEIIALADDGPALAWRAVTASELFALSDDAQMRLRVAYEFLKGVRRRPPTPQHLN